MGRNGTHPIVWLVAATVLGLLGSGCADREPETGPTIRNQGSPAAGPESPNAFAVEVADLFVAIVRAGSDPCAISSAVPDRPMAPRSEADATLAVGLHVAWIRALASSDPAPAGAEELDRLAAELMEAAVTAGFPVDFWETDDALRVLQHPAYVAATEALEVAMGCKEGSVVAGVSGPSS